MVTEKRGHLDEEMIFKIHGLGINQVFHKVLVDASFAFVDITPMSVTIDSIPHRVRLGTKRHRPPWS